MNEFLKVIAGIFVALILCLCLSQRNKEISVLLVLLVCCAVAGASFLFLSPVLDFLSGLQRLIGIDRDYMTVLLKAVGVAILSEIASLVCADGGQAALGKAVQILGAATILWLSLPLYQQVITLIEDVLKNV